MSTPRDEIARWFDDGLKQGAHYMVVMCDTFDWCNYPKYYSSAETALGGMRWPGKMQRVMECYDLTADKSEQMNQRRAMALSA